MKYVDRKLTITQIGMVVKSLLMLGDSKITIESLGDGAYKITTEKR